MHKRELTIHKFHDEFLNIKLNDYILTFDDGLASQVQGIQKIIKKFPDIEIRVYISTGLLNRSFEKATYNESDIAIDNVITGSYTDYMTYDDLIILSKLQQVTIGLHGHKHLNLDKMHQNLSLNNYYKMIKEDIQEMLFSAIQLAENKIIDLSKPIYFCTPFNQLHEIYIGTMRKHFNMYFPNNEIIVTGPDREDILDFDESPSFIERYNDVLGAELKAIAIATRVPIKYLSQL